MKRLALLGVGAIMLFSISSAISSAAVPNIVNYRGRLVDAAGAPVTDGGYFVKFAIYGVPTGGTELWNSGTHPVNTTGGLFSYDLGANTTLPQDLFTSNSTLYLGVTVGLDAEISPRTRFTTSAYSFSSQVSDSSVVSLNATNLGGQAPSHYLDWNNLSGVPQGFADGVDNDAGGDITGVTAGSGLSGGGTAGAVTVSVATNGISATHIASSAVGTSEVALNSLTASDLAAGSVGSSEVANNSLSSADLAANSVTASEIATGAVAGSEILDGSISNADISGTAAISTSKISGTAVNLSSTQNVTGTKIFSGVLRVGDSTMYANNNGIVFGTNHAPFSNTFMNISRDYNTTAGRFGFRVFHKNSSTGNIYGIESEVFSDGVTRRAVLGRASGNFSGPPTGESYGVYGWGERGATAYGVYGRAAFALTNYAGYFFGNAHVTNTLTKGAGAFKIDHPLDPANRYLQHSFVESPDMKNVYDGNVTIDANGEAAVTLPDYFEALNRDFRYQLTAVGAPGPNLHVARKISGNSFRIAGGEPGMEVCWQVTGTRQDAYANAHRIQVEVGKPAGEKGLYMHPVEHSQSETLQLHYEQHKRAESNLRKSGGRK